MTSTQRFWDRHAEGYAKRQISNEEAYQKKLRQTQALLSADMKMFEFGCGTGTTALHHAPFVKHIHAIDISPKMLEIAEQKAASQHVQNITFEVNNIEGFEESEAAYDIVMGHSILHLLDDYETAIQRVHQLLKPGGYFISSTICLKGMAGWLRLLLPFGHMIGLLPRVQSISVEELSTSLTETGFEITTQWQPSEKQGVFIIARKAF